MQNMISILKNSVFISKKGCVHVCMHILETYQQHYFNNKGRETEDPVSGNQMVTKGYTGRK